MTYTFRPAVRENAPLLIGVSGGTGSGKTYSALRLARGLVGPEGTVVMIDTERGRGTHYADEFGYLYAQLEPPFTPARYIEAMRAAEKAGADCIIVDSSSHEWEGTGGLLEWASSIAADMARKYGGSPEKYSFASWSTPKQEHHQWISYMQSATCHIIVCLRAKEKRAMVKDAKGKTEIVDFGWTPITDAELPFECAFLAMLTADKPGIPQFSYKALSHKFADIFTEGAKLDEKMGAKLGAWASGQDAAVKTPPRDLHAEMETASKGGLAELEAWFKGLNRDQQIAIKPSLETYKIAARDYDRMRTSDEGVPFDDREADPPATEEAGSLLDAEERMMGGAE